MTEKDRRIQLYKKYSVVRDLRGLRDVDVCRETGVLQATMSGWKHGTGIPKIEGRKKIADFLEVPVTEFI